MLSLHCNRNNTFCSSIETLSESHTFHRNRRCVPFPSVDDVAIIDEVQMISDEERGAAWTRAILGQWTLWCQHGYCIVFISLAGLPAHEVHMCGHECALNLVQRLAKSAGEKVEVNLSHFFFIFKTLQLLKLLPRWCATNVWLLWFH